MMNDRQFARSFSWMLFFLVLLTIVLIVTGIAVGGIIDDKLQAQSEEFSQRIVQMRTEPVGTLNVGEIATTESPSQPQEDTQVASAENLGQTVYNQACHICHNAGLVGAPKPGVQADWNGRIAQGIDVLYNHAINGFQGEKGVMPPKGGNLLLSDEDVKAAVDYLVSLL